MDKSSTLIRQANLRLRAEMLMRGQTVRGWARAHGLNEETVHAVIRRHWGRPDSKPSGAKTRHILDLLMEEFGDES